MHIDKITQPGQGWGYLFWSELTLISQVTLGSFLLHPGHSLLICRMRVWDSGVVTDGFKGWKNELGPGMSHFFPI